ncbi:MAG: hypothetical protein M0Z71_12495 [Nitrospiraceae bacterium]|nr:hypothetical protein [Nitrospiraceae bacterium]
MIEPSVIGLIQRDWSNAPYGERTRIAHQWAVILGISPGVVFSSLKIGNGRARKAEAKNPLYQEWTKIVSAIKKAPPDGAGEISTDQAVEIGVKWGKLPPDALNVPDATYNAIARKMGLNKKERRVSRFQADRPNRLHHFDASSSKYLYIAGREGEDDYIIKIHRPGSGDYKNKPIPCDRLRPWYYGVVDDHSGRLEGDIYAAAGENSIHSLQAVCHAWSIMGICDELLADQGMLKKGLISRELIARLGVGLPESMPYAKEAHGKIERPWRTGWQRFEKPYYVGDWKKFSILLSELKTQFQTYLAEDYNHKKHRFERSITRMQAWSRVNLHGGIVQIPENAIATAARRIERTVDQDGTLELDGRIYEVQHLHSAKVIVFVGVFDDRIIVQDKADGKKYEVKEFKPNNVGEFTAHADTPHQKLVKESAEMLSGAAPMLYAESMEQRAEGTGKKVVSMPIRTKEERTIEDPFDVDHYADTAAAWVGFCEITGPVMMEAGERRDVEKLFAEHDLSKDFIRNFALEYRAWVEQRRRAAAGA